jgi:transcriptional regulator with XRE-family HTH domain
VAQKKKSNTNERKSPPARSAEQYPPVNDARLAVGALLGFYRRIKRVSQTQAVVATEAGLTPSALGMFEAGQRLPSPEAIDKLATALGLDAFQRQQLQFISTYSRQGPIIGEQWFVPEDVLTGTPIFLRNVHQEAVAQRMASISEMWIVTSRLLALEGEMYEGMKARLLKEDTTFVYFIDNTSGESPIRDLWRRLSADAPELGLMLKKKLQCVLVPASLCLYHYGICNPGQLARMFGRLIVYASGIPVGFLSMDSQQVARAYHLLAPIYQRLQTEPEITTDYGNFRQVHPA